MTEEEIRSNLTKRCPVPLVPIGIGIRVQGAEAGAGYSQTRIVINLRPAHPPEVSDRKTDRS